MSFVWDENLGSGTFTESTAVKPFACIVADRADLLVAIESFALDIAVQGAGQPRTQSGQMSAAVLLRDGVGVAEDRLLIAVVPLNRQLDALPIGAPQLK